MQVRVLIGCFIVVMSHWFGQDARAANLPALISNIKPSVVGVGIHDPLGAPANQLQGTGFVFADGRYVATNYHVIANELDPETKQKRVVFIGQGKRPQVLDARVIDIDPVHDLAILRLSKKLTPLPLAADELLSEGHDIAFTGFPIGAVLGLYPATHKGMIAAISPDATPAHNADQLTVDMLKRLKNPFLIYQLDATAYPGNSGSPVYLQENGVVIAVINKVFVQAGKESALSAPSGISYAIPIKYLRALALKNQIQLN